MPNKCVVFGCNSGYATCKEKGITFLFPLEKPYLLQQWNRVVNRSEWVASCNSVICIKHFEEKYIIRGKKNNLMFCLNPIPTINTEIALKRPSTLPTPIIPRKAPKLRVFQKDQSGEFSDNCKIDSFEDLCDKGCLKGFSCMQKEDVVVFYNVVFNEQSVPQIMESIKVDKNLKVELQYMGNPVPLPPWFVICRDAKLNYLTQLENFPPYITYVAGNSEHSILEELTKRKYYKPKGRPPFTSATIRYALLLRYTSAQAYRLMLEKLPLPSISTLTKIQKGGIDAIKAVTLLLQKQEISKDIILMADEMYLQKGSQYHGGEYVGADEEGNLYKGIVAFIIVGLKKSIPYIIKASPDVTINGSWLSTEICSCISSLSKAGFNVRGVVTDNHSSNVNAFSILQKAYSSSTCEFYINYPDNISKIYLFYDNVHLLKNIRNNLLNSRKFVFPSFSHSINDECIINVPAGYIPWSDLHNIYDKDEKFDGNLRKAPKLGYKSLHPGDNKQNVELALFHETTIAASRNYYPEREDISGFLDLISNWWTIVNSGTRFCPNKLGHAAINGDGKTIFLREFARYLKDWSSNSFFCLSKQTSGAMVRTLNAQASLIEDLLCEGYDFVVPRRLQSDPLEKRFSRYRQMSGGRFLVSLREILTSERILAVNSLLKEKVNFWEEDLSLNKDPVFDEFTLELQSISAEIQEASLCAESVEVA